MHGMGSGNDCIWDFDLDPRGYVGTGHLSVVWILHLLTEHHSSPLSIIMSAWMLWVCLQCSTACSVEDSLAVSQRNSIWVNVFKLVVWIL